MNEKIAVADGNWILHRVYHTDSSDGKHLASRLLSIICRDALAVKAKRLLVAFDGPNVFRHKLTDSYKANRKDDAELDLLHNKDGLVADEGPYKHLEDVLVYLADAGIQAVQYSDYEADDVLASVATANANVALLTRDKDIYQVLRPGVIQYDSSFKVKGVPKPRTVTDKDVEALFGVPPALCVDLQTLTGDGIDNVPRLLRRDVAIRGLKLHGSLKTWLQKDEGVADKLRPQKSQLTLNRKLVRLVTDLKVPVEATKWSTDKTLPLAYFQWKDFCNPKTKGLF